MHEGGQCADNDCRGCLMIHTLPALDGLLHVETNTPEATIAVEDFVHSAAPRLTRPVADVLTELQMTLDARGVGLEGITDIPTSAGHRYVYAQAR